MFVCWLNDPLRQSFSLYRAVSQRERQKREVTDERKMSKQPPPAPTVSAVGRCPTIIQISRTPRNCKLPSTIAPPDHPRFLHAYVVLLGIFLSTQRQPFTTIFVKHADMSLAKANRCFSDKILNVLLQNVSLLLIATAVINTFSFSN